MVNITMIGVLTGCFLILDGILSFIFFHSQPFRNQAVRLVRAFIGMALVIFSLAHVAF